jgi:hypothetical protein
VGRPTPGAAVPDATPFARGDAARSHATVGTTLLVNAGVGFSRTAASGVVFCREEEETRRSQLRVETQRMAAEPFSPPRFGRRRVPWD